MAIILDGKKVAAKVKAEVKDEIEQNGYTPTLCVFRVGSDPASETYVKSKTRDCEECGIDTKTYEFQETNTIDLLNHIRRENLKFDTDGILVQLPLPDNINQDAIIQSISGHKDVDCFCDSNVGALYVGHQLFAPCTPSGIIRLLDEYNIDIEGKHCVVIGRSTIVGKPTAVMLLERGGTVTVCHSKTTNLAEYTKSADILVSAIGKPRFITADMVKEGAVVIDVGINRDKHGKLCGDVDYDAVFKKAGYITPVPGGVGLMTRAMLMINTLKAYKIKNGIVCSR